MKASWGLSFCGCQLRNSIPTLEGMGDLIVVLDEATREVYSIPAWCCRRALQGTMEALKRLFPALVYTHRASHFITTRTGRHNSYGLTHIQRALGELGIELIRSYSPQARGRMERLWETWQGRLLMELRARGLCSRGADSWPQLGCLFITRPGLVPLSPHKAPLCP